MATRTRQNEEIVRRYIEAIDERDWETFADFLADDVVVHQGDEDISGQQPYEELLMEFHDGFSELTHSIADTVAENDKVAVRTTLSGIHDGEFRGIEPTGEEIENSGISIYRIEDREIAEHWIVADQLGLLQQLGVVEPSGK